MQVDYAAEARWAASATDDEILELLGRAVTDGTARFPVAQYLAMGREWFKAHEPQLKSLVCEKVMSLTGADSDPITVISAVASAVIPPAWLPTAALVYAIALVTRKAARGYCDDPLDPLG